MTDTTDDKLLAWGRASLAAFWDAVAAIPRHDTKSMSGWRHIGNAYRNIMSTMQQERLVAGLTTEQASRAIVRAAEAERAEMRALGWDGDSAAGWHLPGSNRHMTYGEAVREQRKRDRMRDVSVEVDA